MKRKPALIISLILLAAFSQAGCFLPPVCDPESEEFDQEKCLSNTLGGALYSTLYYAAYGYSEPASPSPCPAGLVCRSPSCIRVGQDGAFRRFNSNEVEFLAWKGDRITTTLSHSCEPSSWGLVFVATSPAGPSGSASSQVFQVIDLNAAIPPASRPNLRRLRADAAFLRTTDPARADLDLQFGLRVDAYAGDPALFPRSGEPADLPVEGRLASVESIAVYDVEGPEWQRLYLETMLPEGTDFLVVLLEAYEDVVNESSGNEFPLSSVMDNVRVAVDARNLAPQARPDEAATRAGEPVRIPVLSNDIDPDDYIDPSTVEVAIEAEHGTTAVQDDGSILYTSEPGFGGQDQFTYRITDPEGLAGGAPVTVTVEAVNRPPVAVADTAMTAPGIAIDIDVLANDSDPDGDPLTIIAFGQPSNGAVGVVVADNTIRYTPRGGFTGTDRFAYVIADDEGAQSNEVEVVIIVQ